MRHVARRLQGGGTTSGGQPVDSLRIIACLVLQPGLGQTRSQSLLL